jgi:hypothetical protein
MTAAAEVPTTRKSGISGYVVKLGAKNELVYRQGTSALGTLRHARLS